MTNALHWATFAVYLSGTMCYLAYVLWQKKGLARMGSSLLWLGLGIHTGALLIAWLELGAFPALSLRQSLDVLSWAVMAAALLVNIKLEVRIMGAMVGPICTLLLLAATWMPGPGAAPGPALKSFWVPIHVVGLMGGYGLLALNFLAGLLYLAQERAIRAKKLGGLFQRLPSLGRLDSFGQWTMASGFSLITIGLIAGAVYAHQVMGSFLRGTPKEVFALVTWLAYAALVHTRFVQGWRGRRGAVLSVAAFALVLFTFLGAGLLFKDYHSFSELIHFTGQSR